MVPSQSLHQKTQPNPIPCQRLSPQILELSAHSLCIINIRVQGSSFWESFRIQTNFQALPLHFSLISPKSFLKFISYLMIFYCTWKVRVIERVGEIIREMFRLLIHSQNGCNDHSWASSKLGTRSFFQTSMCMQRTKILSHLLLLYQVH